MSPLPLILYALAGLCTLFGMFYLLARRMDNYGIVDIVWSYSFAALVLYYGLFGGGWIVRKALIATMAMLWSLRLGTHLYRRVISHHPVEDGRYVQLRKDWAGNFAPKMFGFFQMQAGSVVLLGAGFFIICLNSDARLHPLEIAGAVLWLFALTGEAISDAQLSAFKRVKENKGRVCDVGLWHHSRHPNYFFEWLTWLGYTVIALPAPFGILGLSAPALILFFLLRLTGIPATEEHALRSRKDYRRYQETTSAFVPWFKKTSTR